MLVFDYIIAGGGIAGLYTALKLHSKYSNARIAILEASSRLGGRLHTIHKDGLTFDAGGARFNTDQLRINRLVSELGLDNKKVAITNDSRYIEVGGKHTGSIPFKTLDDFINDCIKYIKKHNIQDTELENLTILEFASKYYKSQYPDIEEFIVSTYPYYAELGILNAKEGFQLFTHEFSPDMKYYVLDSGLDQLILKLTQRLKQSSNIKIFLNTPLIAIEAITNKKLTRKSTIPVEHSSRYKIITIENNKIFTASNIILALPQPALKKIKFLMHHKTVARMINAISPQPLYRIYARYPLTKSKPGNVWFADLPKIITDLPIKYIIPMNYEKGLIMISYTDSRFARYWLRHLEKGTLEKELNRQLSKLFPDIDIPEPLWIHHAYWDMGAGYWRPGFSRQEIMPKIIKPLSNEEIYICGENYSSHQAWVEGALETVDMVLAKITNSTPSNLSGGGVGGGGSGSNSKKNKTYTIEEVAKHNKKSDAWIVIDGIVADITKWIPLHPGGDIIMRGVGKDASKLFHNIGHSANAKKMLKKYKIGILAKS